jgi:hypothetical protein
MKEERRGVKQNMTQQNQDNKKFKTVAVSHPI